MPKVFRNVMQCIMDGSKVYRYLLEVEVTKEKTEKRLIVILKNPSTADEKTTDSTTNHVEAWARNNGFQSVLYLNLFAFRSTDPKFLNDHLYDYIVGPENDHILTQYLNCQDEVIIAWGTPSKITKTRYDKRIKEVQEHLFNNMITPFIVKSVSNEGYPLHGMRWGKYFPKLLSPMSVN